jgi:SAM-dependent methyltransferase
MRNPRNSKTSKKTRENSSKVIFNKFATYYDQIYHDKDYSKEVNFVVATLKKYGLSKTKNLLDLGCGTGGHDLILAKKGYTVTGIDMSNAALNIARKKLQKADYKVEFLKKDMTDFKINKKYDACISMFSSFCYLTDHDQLKRALSSAINHLRPGGLFIFDYWNGNTVINERPSTKVKITKFDNRHIIRIATPKIDFARQVCAIEYHCIISENNKIIDNFTEVHNIKYYFTDDLTNYLKDVGFEIVNIAPMNNAKPDSNTYLNNWYFFAIVRKK